MRYAHIFCGWSKRLKPSESRPAFIRSAGFCGDAERLANSFRGGDEFGSMRSCSSSPVRTRSPDLELTSRLSVSSVEANRHTAGWIGIITTVRLITLCFHSGGFTTTHRTANRWPRKASIRLSVLADGTTAWAFRIIQQNPSSRRARCFGHCKASRSCCQPHAS
jgi:hypothetical protein